MNPPDSPSPTLQLVGDGAALNLARAASYLETVLSSGDGSGSPTATLNARIERSTAALVRALHGFDAFDVLALLQRWSDLGAITGRVDPQAAPESTYVAQEVVGHVLLGMGLPRTELTGEFRDMPNPETLLRLGGSIAEDASNIIALGTTGSEHPLEELAGIFASYELRVRGRQYETVARDINDGLLQQSQIQLILERDIGCTLSDVRAVRVAVVDLIESRLLEGTDRVRGLLVRSGQGEELSVAEDDEIEQDVVRILSECRRIGAVTVEDVALKSGLSTSTTRSVLNSFFPAIPATNVKGMVARYCRGERIQPWGAIADRDEYVILSGFLDESELRRDFERQLTGRRGWEQYLSRRSKFAESCTVATMTTLLHGERPRWEQQKYLAPLDAYDESGLSRSSIVSGASSKICESDALFVVDGVAFCVEVKAGSITAKARRGSIQSLARNLKDTLKSANDQADRLAKLIRVNQGVWSDKKEWIDLSDVREVHCLVVTLDDLGPLSLGMNHLVDHGMVTTPGIPWIVSLHDLIVTAQVLDRPAQFLTYLRRRCGRKLATMVRAVDELDMLMWFVNGGMYFDPDPRDVADLTHQASPTLAADLKRHDEQPRVVLSTLTDPLDAWFGWINDEAETAAAKPSRVEERWVESFLTCSETAKSPGWLRFGADLVGTSGAAQKAMGQNVRACCRRAKLAKREKSYATHGVSENGPWLLAVIAQSANERDSVAYAKAKKYQTHSDRSMLLLHDARGRLTGSLFDDRPWAVDDGAQISTSGLVGLKATLAIVPPSAKRKTKQLRGPKSAKQRKRLGKGTRRVRD